MPLHLPGLPGHPGQQLGQRRPNRGAILAVKERKIRPKASGPPRLLGSGAEMSNSVFVWVQLNMTLQKATELRSLFAAKGLLSFCRNLARGIGVSPAAKQSKFANELGLSEGKVTKQNLWNYQIVLRVRKGN